MKPSQRLLLLLMAACSIGAVKECNTVTTNMSSLQYYCYTDPPVGCAAFCGARHTVTFAQACSHISAGPLEDEFETQVMAGVESLLAQGIEVCPEANLTEVVTPCSLGIFPQEWPGQDHDVCHPAPPGCH